MKPSNKYLTKKSKYGYFKPFKDFENRPKVNKRKGKGKPSGARYNIATKSKVTQVKNTDPMFHKKGSKVKIALVA